MTGARVRLLATVVPLISSSLAFLAWSQSWVEVQLTDGRVLVAGGDVAAPAIPPLAIAALALVGALALAGLVFRVILGVLQAVLGAGIIASGILAVSDPVQSAAATITAATGVEGLESVRALVDGVAVTVWPPVGSTGGGCSAAAAPSSAGMSMGVITCPRESTWARSITFWSSRTLPSQGRRISVIIAA